MAKRFRQTKPAVPRDVEASLRKQAFAAPRVVELMNAIRTDEEKPLCIEFFFYAKEEPDAGRLVAALSALGYNAQHHHSAHYAGGIIAPGLAAMTDYLHEKTALLPCIKIREVKTAIGKSTEEAMLIGAGTRTACPSRTRP